MEKEVIPLFPLGLVAFPKEKLNLHIFEPRYKQLVHECYKKEMTFGVVPYRKGLDLVVGTEMEIIEISRTYEDGKMDIKTRGIRAFKINDFYSKLGSKLYPGGEVEFIEDVETLPMILEFQVIMEMVGELYGLLKIDAPVPEYDEQFSIFEIAHKLGLSFDQELELLKIRNEVKRMMYVKAHLERFIPSVKQMEELRSRVKMNGHFKDIIPPDLGI